MLQGTFNIAKYDQSNTIAWRDYDYGFLGLREYLGTVEKY